MNWLGSVAEICVSCEVWTEFINIIYVVNEIQEFVVSGMGETPSSDQPIGPPGWGSLESETVKYDHESCVTRTRE
jgi:hypothetical protein